MYKIHWNIFVTYISQLSLSPLSNVIFALPYDANIVQMVKTCYKKKSENRFWFCCFERFFSGYAHSDSHNNDFTSGKEAVWEHYSGYIVWQQWLYGSAKEAL